MIRDTAKTKSANINFASFFYTKLPNLIPTITSSYKVHANVIILRLFLNSISKTPFSILSLHTHITETLLGIPALLKDFRPVHTEVDSNQFEAGLSKDYELVWSQLEQRLRTGLSWFGSCPHYRATSWSRARQLQQHWMHMCLIATMVCMGTTIWSQLNLNGIRQSQLLC